MEKPIKIVVVSPSLKEKGLGDEVLIFKSRVNHFQISKSSNFQIYN